jgi:hypothetical protein
LGNRQLKPYSHQVLENPATGKTERLMLTLKYDAKGKPYLIKE